VDLGEKNKGQKASWAAASRVETTPVDN